MDTRQAIQESPDPPVLSVSFNEDSSRFVCGLGDGLRSPGKGKSIAVAAALDDRYFSLVGWGRGPSSSRQKLEVWDNKACKKVNEYDIGEPILGVRMTKTILAVVLEHRTVCFQYGVTGQDALVGPSAVMGLHNTASNLYGLCCVRGDRMVLPGLTLGQVQIIWLHDRTKRIIRAHSSELRQMDLSRDGEILATCSKQGTLIRVFSTSTLSQTHEFRRGFDQAIVYGLSISPSKQFIASTSDKGTLHIFDLRSLPKEEPRPPIQHKRSSLSRPPAQSRPRPGSIDSDAVSVPSVSSSPRAAAAGFYGPPPDITHIPPASGPSTLSALAKLPGMPRALSDVRSMTSAPFYLGSDPHNWQGQPAHTITTAPNGQRTRVRVPNAPLPGAPDGRPPKGVLAWDSDGGDRRLWVVGGGSDARWEVFELIETADEGHKLRLVKRGFRKYLSRQFPEEET